MLLVNRGLLLVVCLGATLITGVGNSTADGRETAVDGKSSGFDHSTDIVFQTDWGQPPADEWDAGEEWPPLPSAEGWARFQGMGWAFNWWEVLTAASGIVVLHDHGHEGSYRLAAYSLRDGEEVWTSTLPAFAQYQPHLNCGDILVYSFIDQGSSSGLPSIGGLDLKTGRTLWSRTASRPLAAGKAGVWVTSLIPGKPFLYGDGTEPANSDLFLLDPSSGEELQAFKLGLLAGFAEQIPDNGQSMAVVTETRLIVVNLQGEQTAYGRPNAGWEARLAMDEKGVLEVSSPPIPPLPPDLLESRPDESAQEQEQRFTESAYYKATTTGAVRCLNYSGKELWQASFEPKESYGAAVISPRLGPGVAAVIERQGVLVFDRDSGTELKYPELTRDSYIQPRVLGQQVFAYLDDMNGAQGRAYSVSLLDGRLTSAPAAEPAGLHGAYADGFLIFNASSPGGPADDTALPSCVATVCMKVDEGLTPIPGTLALLNPPEPFDALRTRFLASNRPLHDTELMKEIVSNGQRAVHRLFQATDSNQSAHLEALTLAAIYIERHQQGYASAANMAIYNLRTRGAALDPLLLQWQTDPRFAMIEQQLSNLILTSGGTAGSAIAAKRYAIQEYAPLKPIEPPFDVQKPESWIRGSDAQHYETMQWVEVEAAGKRYAIFTGYGPVGYQDITLGIDHDDDRRFEEVMPTGISDLCLMQFYPSGVSLFASGPGLTLEVTGSSLTIGHHTPKLKYDEEFKYADLEGAIYGKTTLALASLRKDSDSDGLTDLTEQMLLLNGASKDTDGDGVEDLLDPTPNANAAGMGKLERGVARALEYYLSDSGVGLSSDPTLPYEAEFIMVHGAGQVAFARGGMRTICISTPEQFRQFGSYGGGLPGGTGISARVGLDEHWEYHNDNDASAPWGVALSFSGSGAFVELREIDGEYYPVRKYETWIS